MKRNDLERALRLLGWWLKRHGAKHDIWTNGEDDEAVPRHNEIGELLAKQILKNAKLAMRSKNYENRWNRMEN